eukprot:4207915-Prymnesium_polylepis.1
MITRRQAPLKIGELQGSITKLGGKAKGKKEELQRVLGALLNIRSPRRCSRCRRLLLRAVAAVAAADAAAADAAAADGGAAARSRGPRSRCTRGTMSLIMKNLLIVNCTRGLRSISHYEATRNTL